MTYRIAALYKFVPVADIAATKQRLLPLFEEWGLCGSLLIAPEGINGTLAGQGDAIDKLVDLVGKEFGLEADLIKFSEADEKPFQRLRLRLKKEIITFKQEKADPNIQVGTYVKPQDWNALISDPEVLLIDTRNDYEVAIGTFKGAIDPKTETFREFPDYIKANFDPSKHKKVAMFCTGGIRCEKASSYMLGEGFEEVYHLKGGILKYFEEVPQEQSLWDGDCFVFDNRVTVRHDLTEGEYDQCHACRHPISVEDRASEHYSPGVSCPHCWDSLSEKTRRSAIDRQKQIELAKARNQPHPIGYNYKAEA